MKGISEKQVDRFWDWFRDNSQLLASVAGKNHPVIETLSERIKEVHESFVFELSGVDVAPHEFIVSGDGIKDMIPFVNRMVAAAPSIPGWKFTAFRPRMDDYCRYTLNYEGTKFDPKELWFWAGIDDGGFDIIVYHPDYEESERDTYVAGAYILLDMALGEYDVMTGIRYIDHQRLPDDPESEELLPFSELRQVFDEFHRAGSSAN